MKKEITLAPIYFRGKPNHKLIITYYLMYDQHNKRSFTIIAPYKNYNDVVNGQHNTPLRLTNIFLALMKKSGYQNLIEDGKIYMSFNDYMNFNLKQLNNISIYSKFLL